MLMKVHRFENDVERNCFSIYTYLSRFENV